MTKMLIETYLPRLLSGEIYNLWVWFEHTEVYIRVGPRLINGEITKCIQIANIQTQEKYQRKGAFTRLVQKIREMSDLPLYLENTRNDFADALVKRHGWVVIGEATAFGTDLVLV